MDMYKDTCLEAWNTSFCVEFLLKWLFGLIKVLNGGKFCIEKKLGFRAYDVRFFKLMFFFLP